MRATPLPSILGTSRTRPGVWFPCRFEKCTKNDKRLQLQNKGKYDPPHPTLPLEKHLGHRLTASPFHTQANSCTCGLRATTGNPQLAERICGWKKPEASYKRSCFCMIPVTWNVQKRHNYRPREDMRVARAGAGEKDGKWVLMGERFLWGWGKYCKIRLWW